LGDIKSNDLIYSLFYELSSVLLHALCQYTKLLWPRYCKFSIITMNPMEMLSKNVIALSISSALATFLHEETWKCHQEWSFSMTVQPPQSTHWAHVAIISVGTSGLFTHYTWPCLVRLQLVVFTDLTIMRKWTLLFMNGFKCQSLISATMEFLSLC